VTYAYWIQDVAFMDSADNQLTFENNIWNFSSPAGCLDSTGVTGNGTVYPYEGCQGYYAVGSTDQPGADLDMPDPGDFGLLVRSYVTDGVPGVAFEYWDGVTSWYVTYDNVVFPWAQQLDTDRGFVVDGEQYNPLGLFYDAELTIGGPGGGSGTEAQSVTDITSRLLYWNGHNLEAPPAVWNFGSNTAEAVSNVQSFFGHDAGGFPETIQLNGTTRNATPASAYDQGRVGTLAIAAPGISAGTIAVPGDSFRFVGAAANLTLVPGAYPVWVNDTGGDHALGVCYVYADTVTLGTVADGCGPSASTPVASAAGADVGQSVSFTTTVTGAGSGGDSFVWHTSPSGLGCAPSTSPTLDCTPTAAGSYRVNVTITDSSDRASTSGNLSFTVSTVPEANAPTASPSTVETGARVTFSESVSGGASPFSYAWSGLPGSCTDPSTSSPVCTPTAAGSFAVSVTVTDANGEASESSALHFVVEAGPSVAAPTASPAGSVDVGRPVVFTTAASGGSGGYAYAWSGLPRGCASASSATLSCTPSAVGATTIDVTVTDSAGGRTTSGTLPFTVQAGPTVGSVSIRPRAPDAGETVTFSAVGVAGGTGAYRYAWTGLPVGCASENASAISCEPSAAGSGNVSVTVVDSDGANASAALPFTILSDPTFSSVGASRASADVGQPVTFSVVGLAGGTGVYSYAWSDLPAGCVAGNVSSVTCALPTATTLHVTVTVTDSNGVSVARTLAFAVDPAPAAGSPRAAPGSVPAGTTVTFSIAVSGGSGSYAYVWTGLPAGCAPEDAPTIVCAPSAVGSYWINVTVTDSNGVAVTGGPLAFSVTSRASTGLFGLAPIDGDALVLGALAVALAAVTVLVVRSRRRPARPSP